jgi:hypothetical protein
MIVTIKPKNGKPIKKKFSDPKEAIAWINSTTAELAAQQNAHLTGGGLCAQCGSPAWTHSVIDHEFVEPHHPQVA